MLLYNFGNKGAVLNLKKKKNTLFVNFDLITRSEFILKCLFYANNTHVPDICHRCREFGFFVL